MSPLDAPSCARCRWFSPAARDIETQLPGLRSLSSAYASVRSEDGVCSQHDRYVAALSFCAAYQARAGVLQRKTLLPQ
jgi:hypothetical protein